MLNAVDLLSIQYALTNEITRLEKGKRNEYLKIESTINAINAVINNHKDALKKIDRIINIKL